jgi:PhnB protein
MRFKDAPQMENITAADHNKIMHISLPIGTDNFLMGSDVVDSMLKNYTSGNNFQISISADNEAEADKLFNGLSTGGQVSMPMQKTFWGSYFGMLADKYGILWMVSCPLSQPS